MQNKKGFTLVELLIVVAIIGILAAIAIPQFASYRARSYCAAAQADLNALAKEQELYFADNSVYAADTASLSNFTASTVGGVQDVVTVTAANTASWTATAAHPNCDSNNDGTPEVMSWDSAAGGLQ